MMDISGAAQIPATKLFGRSPAGMNATGDTVAELLRRGCPNAGVGTASMLNKLLPVLCMSVFGAVPDDLDFEFDR